MTLAKSERGISQYFGVAEAELGEPIKCHIIQIFNIAESREKSLEEWRYYQNPNKAPFERMEHVSRPIVYGIDLDTPEQEQKARSIKATYKLLLRDIYGNYFYAVEIEELSFLRSKTKSEKTPINIQLGGSMLLKEGTVIADGVVLLRKHQFTYLPADPASELTRQLNENIVGRTIEMIERLLSEPT